MVDAFNDAPGPIQATATSLLAITAATAGGIWLGSRVIRSISDTRDALANLNETGGRSRGVLRGIALAGAGIAGLTIVVGTIKALQDATEESLPGLETLTGQLLALQDGKVASLSSEFDSLGASLDRIAKSDAFDLRDLFAMWHFDQDPRFDDVKGKVGLDSQVRYVFGGPEDKCGGGVLQSKGHVKVLDLDMFGERYDGGEGEYDFTWFDRDATIQGVDLDVPSITLRKGSGLILGSFGLRRGARGE
jgi:hypothetical protein